MYTRSSCVQNKVPPKTKGWEKKALLKQNRESIKKKGKGRFRQAIKETNVGKTRMKRQKERERTKKAKQVQEGSPTSNFIIGNYGLRMAERWGDICAGGYAEHVSRKRDLLILNSK